MPEIKLGPYQVSYEDPETLKYILAHGENYEGHLWSEVKKSLQHSEGFMDVGANVGFYTVMAKCLKGPDFPTVSVEVNPINVRLLCRTIQENGFSNSVVLPVAASDTVGVVFGNDSWNTGLARSRINDDWRFLYPAMPLDMLFFGKIGTIKIDVEGFELAALNGMTALIAGDSPTIFFEYNLHCMRVVGVDPLELLGFVLDQGYKLTVLDYLPGMRAEFTDPEECARHIAKFGEICDLMAEPRL